jgi:hypothetical protein
MLVIVIIGGSGGFAACGVLGQCAKGHEINLKVPFPHRAAFVIDIFERER